MEENSNSDIDFSIEAYLASMTEKERAVYKIAEKHLDGIFIPIRNNHYLNWKQKLIEERNNKANTEKIMECEDKGNNNDDNNNNKEKDRKDSSEMKGLVGNDQSEIDDEQLTK